VGCDVIAFTESEAHACRSRGDAFARAVFGEGLLLATRRDDASALTSGRGSA
jgi:hypothetical protein